MARKFDLGEFAKAMAVSNSDTEQEQIVYIDETLISGDDNNFYTVEGIASLAANIELIGLQQPIRVREDPEDEGGYIVVSGHRRLTAIRTILKVDDPERWKTVPCIVEKPGQSAAMQELRLIYANSDTRTMSSADLSRQAERVEALLYQLQEEGYEFPGRMRDHVAQACNVSRTKLARLKVIRENLIQEYRPFYDRNDISESVAYSLAKMPAEFQKKVFIACKDKVVSSYADHVAEKVQSGEFDYVGCLTCPDGSTCTHMLAFIRHDFNSPSWDQCGGNKCCMKCHYADRGYAECSNICAKMKAAKKQKNAEKKAENEKQERKRTAKFLASNAKLAQRLVFAADAAGVADDVIIPRSYGSQLSVSALRMLSRGELPDKCNLWSEDCITPSHAELLVKTAKILQCSTDYILCLTEDLRPAPAPEGQLMISGWMPGGTNPAHACDAVVDVDLGTGLPAHRIFAAWSGSAWTKHGDVITFPVVRWMELPDVERRESHD